MDDKGEIDLRDVFLESVEKKAKVSDRDYIKTIQSLEPEMKGQGTAWLQGIVDQTLDQVMALLPSLNGHN